MKARTETGEQQPFNYEPTRKLCKGCHEPCLVNAAGYCDDCEHKYRMQNVINGVHRLGKGVTEKDKALFWDATYEAALPLVRIDE